MIIFLSQQLWLQVTIPNSNNLHTIICIEYSYLIPKETVAAITILNKNTKVKVLSPDGDTEYFDIVAGVLQGDTLAP